MSLHGADSPSIVRSRGANMPRRFSNATRTRSCLSAGEAVSVSALKLKFAIDCGAMPKQRSKIKSAAAIASAARVFGDIAISTKRLITGAE